MSRILVVDDEEGIRMAIGRALRLYGYEVLFATNAADGERSFRQNRPGLVIADIVMPGKSGLEMLISLRADFPEIRAIAMSGGGGQTAGANDLAFLLGVAEGAGACKTMAKPFELEELLSAVRALLDNNLST